ncbi:MAG: hypothetical protein ABFD15_09140 [Methanofastidiosum sp.]
MGDYSAICAVTGLPITSRQTVIGFELEPYRYDPTRSRYVPKSWPVEGEYNCGGGIEGHDLSPNVALVHKEVWDNTEMFWHYLNRKCGKNFLDVKSIMAAATKRFEMDHSLPKDLRDRFTLADQVFYVLRDILGATDEGLVLREMFDAKENNVTLLPDDLCFIHRSAFGQLLVEKMIKGWTEEDQATLYKLICLYSGQAITGKQLVPSNQPYIEQYPDYKQRIKVLTFTSKLAKKFQKDA